MEKELSPQLGVGQNWYASGLVIGCGLASDKVAS